MRACIESALATGKVFRGLQIRHQFQEIGEKVMRVGGNRIPVATEAALVLLSIEEERGAPGEGGPE